MVNNNYTQNKTNIKNTNNSNNNLDYKKASKPFAKNMAYKHILKVTEL